MNPIPQLPVILPRLFAVCLLSGSTASAAIPGDLDVDGKVSVADHLLLQQHLRGERTLTPDQASAADMDASGSLTIADLDAIRDVLLERFPPAVVASEPPAYSVLGGLAAIELTFNKPYHDDSHVPDGISLFEAGPDRHLGTADDIAIAGNVAASPPTLDFTLTAPADPGAYGLRAGPPIADFQGRPMIPFLGKFLIPGNDPARDSDFDGIPDLEEIANGTNPLLADSDGDFADDLLERDSGTDPNDPDSVPGEILNPRTRMIVMTSLPVSYSNFPVDSATTSPDWVSVRSQVASYANYPVDIVTTPPNWVSVRSPVVSYVNMPLQTSTTPSDWVYVRSPVVSYANMPLETTTTPPDWVSVRSAFASYANLPLETTTTPSDWVSVRSAVVSYANMPLETTTTPSDWISVRSAVVSYANMPLETTTTPSDGISVRSPVVSYGNAPVEAPDPVLAETITISSPVISYENSASL